MGKRDPPLCAKNTCSAQLDKTSEMPRFRNSAGTCIAPRTGISTTGAPLLLRAELAAAAISEGNKRGSSTGAANAVADCLYSVLVEDPTDVLGLALAPLDAVAIQER